MYTAVSKADQILTGTGTTLIVTGWTPKERVSQHIPTTAYAALGQLYNAATGLDVLIRNILANPYVKALVGLIAGVEDKNSGSVKCLFDFFDQGVELGQNLLNKPCWKVCSSVPGYIDIDIELEDLELIRKNVKLYKSYSVSDLIQICTMIDNSDHKFWSTPKIFKDKEYESSLLPGPLYGHCMRFDTVADAWPQILKLIRSTGHIRTSQWSSKWQELISLTVVVSKEPDTFKLLSVDNFPTKEYLEQYVNQIISDVNTSTGDYTYGQRIHSWFNVNQVDQVVETLSKDFNSARAVINLWDVEYDFNKRNPPCLNHLWFRIVKDELILNAVFRSNDMCNAWPSNAYGLIELQKIVLNKLFEKSNLNLKRGPLITTSLSAHIYEDSWAFVDNYLTTYKPVKTYADPSGDFIISVENGSIIVVIRSMSKSGDPVKTYKHTDPLKLAYMITSDAPYLQPDHAVYIGLELQKAYNCIQLNLPYVQDKLTTL